MQKSRYSQNIEPRLRVLFTDGFAALDLPAGATLGDIAERVTRLARRRHGSPAAIVVRMAAPRTDQAPASTH